MQVKRGDIYYADLRPVVGSEQGGVRPVLIVQNDVGNRYSPTVIAAAITSQKEKSKLPTHIELDSKNCGLSKDSVVLLEQIRTIVAPLAKKPESILIRRLDKPEDLEKREQHYVIVCENDDLGRLIGRHGINSSSARTLIMQKIKPSVRNRPKAHFTGFPVITSFLPPTC